MSDQQNIGDFFAKQKAKKQKNQKQAPKASGPDQTASTKKLAEETKKEDNQPSQSTNQQEFAESSDEETNIVLDDNSAVIKDAKEVEASKRKENDKQQLDRFGWGGLDKKNPSAAKSSAEPTKASAPIDFDAMKSLSGQPKKVSEVNFKKGPQQFTRSKNMINQQEFPELGEIDKKPEAVSKKDSTSIGHFGSAFAGPKPKDGFVKEGFKEREARPYEERKGGEAKMPVFTKKMKVTTDSSNLLENIPVKQTYDFSSLGLSAAATNKTAAERAKEREENPERNQAHGERTFENRDRDRDREPGERGERAERGGREGRGRGGYGGGFDKGGDRRDRKQSDVAKTSDDSFEEVKERVKRGPAQFSRGGKNYGGKTDV